MRAAIIKRSVKVRGRKTSVSLEDEFWNALNAIAERQRVTVSHLVQQIDRARGNANLSSSIRVFVFNDVCTNGKVAPPPDIRPSAPLQSVV